MKTIFFLFIALVISTASSSAWAYFQLDFMKAKNAASKSESQWTLAGWLSQKSRVGLMDQWLAMNRSKRMFEMNWLGAYSQHQLKTVSPTGVDPVNHYGRLAQLDTYFWFLNLYGEYALLASDQEAFGGAAGLRLLGSTAQTTSLVARYGWRKWQNYTTQENFENQYAEGVLQIYVVSSFGLQGRYRKYFSNTSTAGRSFSGERSTGGAFIEIGDVRFFGDLVTESLKYKSSTAETEEKISGTEFGLRLFF